MGTRNKLGWTFGVAVLTAVGPAFAQGERRDEEKARPRVDLAKRVEMLRWAPEDVREVALLLNGRVRDELKLTDEQVDRIKQVGQKVAEKHREAFGGLLKAEEGERGEKFRALVLTASEEVKKELDVILKPDQRKRLDQLALQFAGPRALTDAEFREKLDLTEEQTKKLRELAEEFGRSVRDLPRDADERDEARQKYRTLWRETVRKVNGILTDEQKAKWKEMAGEPFDFDLRPGRRDDQDDDRGAGEGRGRRPERKDSNP